MVAQSRPGREEAEHWAFDKRYGSSPSEVHVGPLRAMAYELGSEVPDDDPDGQMPAVVVWCNGDRFFLVSSHDLPAVVLLRIASSM